jgi:hypothetical protein
MASAPHARELAEKSSKKTFQRRWIKRQMLLKQ